MRTIEKGYYTFEENLIFNPSLTDSNGISEFISNNVTYYGLSVYISNRQMEYGAFIVYDESLGGWQSGYSRTILIEQDEIVSDDFYDFFAGNTTAGYRLSYDVDGGIPIIYHSNVSYIKASDLPTAIKPHYSFDGWYYENTFTTQVQVGDLISSDTTIYAKFIELYSVHFETNGGTAVTDLVDVLTITSLPTTTKTGYTFLGWFYADDTQAQVGDVLSADITLYAHWQEIYDVIFDTDGGTAVSNLIDVTTITSLPTTTKQGFSFGGWFYDLDYTIEAHVGDPVTHNTILYAKWTFTGTFYATFYNCSAEKERVVKYNFLSNATTYDIYALHPSSLKAPIIDIQKSNNFNFNYCYIPMWDKYYFVTNVSNMLNNIWRISLKCDVLMTYRKQIKKLNCLISRQENDYNAYLVDEKIPTQNNNNIEVIDITTDNRIKSTTTSYYSFVVEIGGRIN